MSIDIGFVGQTQNTPPAPGAASAQTAPEIAATAADQQAVSLDVDTLPAAPPPELRGAIATAANAYEALQSSGRRLHFALDAPTGRLTIELRDLTGNVLSTLNPSHVLAAADGNDLS
jgi:hypothetical protein